MKDEPPLPAALESRVLIVTISFLATLRRTLPPTVSLVTAMLGRPPDTGLYSNRPSGTDVPSGNVMNGIAAVCVVPVETL